jgi:hypothetical protein
MRFPRLYLFRSPVAGLSREPSQRSRSAAIHRRPSSLTMKDPFEAAVEEQDSPPESPAPPEEDPAAADAEDYDRGGPSHTLPSPQRPSSSTAPPASLSAAAARSKGQAQKEQDEDEEEEDHMEVDLHKLPSSTGDLDKLAKMKYVPNWLCLSFFVIIR